MRYSTRSFPGAELAIDLGNGEWVHKGMVSGSSGNMVKEGFEEVISIDILRLVDIIKIGLSCCAGSSVGDGGVRKDLTSSTFFGQVVQSLYSTSFNRIIGDMGAIRSGRSVVRASRWATLGLTRTMELCCRKALAFFTDCRRVGCAHFSKLIKRGGGANAAFPHSNKFGSVFNIRVWVYLDVWVSVG